MRAKKVALINGVLFFFIWLAILYAGADHPPPLGFIVIILLDSIAALLVYLRAPVYLNWMNTRKNNRFFYVLLDGLDAGLVFALLAILLRGGGESGVTPSMTAYLIWFIVLGVVGMGNAIFIYFINSVFAQIMVGEK